MMRAAESTYCPTVRHSMTTGAIIRKIRDRKFATRAMCGFCRLRGIFIDRALHPRLIPAFADGDSSDNVVTFLQELPMQTPHEILADLWTLAGGDPSALEAVTLTGEEPQLPSSFRVAAAAQASIAAAGLAAAQVWKLRSGQNQDVAVDM